MPPWQWFGKGWRNHKGGPWPGKGPWSFLPPWERPGWYYGGHRVCWRVFGAPGWVIWGRHWMRRHLGWRYGGCCDAYTSTPYLSPPGWWK